MRILLLSDINSAHTHKWRYYLDQEGVDVFIFSLTPPSQQQESYVVNNTFLQNKNSSVGKLEYLKLLPELKKNIRELKPNIVHAHYATSYGLLGALSGFQPFLISVWGSDVFSFPRKGMLQEKLLKYNLSKAKIILSTSEIMAKETLKYTNKIPQVIPFGIDLQKFDPDKQSSIEQRDYYSVGIIKPLEKSYGIEYLLEAISKIKNTYSDIDVRLSIIGKGSLRKELVKKTEILNIKDKVAFLGYIQNDQIPKYHAQYDLEVYPSIHDSFGVSVVEAQAMKKAVIVNNIEGLPEVIKDGETGLVIPTKNTKILADRIVELLKNKELRQLMGNKGRERVQKKYDIRENTKQMIAVYYSVLKK